MQVRLPQPLPVHLFRVAGFFIGAHMSDDTNASTEQPPIDNDYVAEGTEQFTPVTIAAGAPDPKEPVAPVEPEESVPQTAEEAAAGEKHELLAWMKAEMLKIEGWPESVWRRVDGVFDTAKSNVPPKETK